MMHKATFAGLLAFAVLGGAAASYFLLADASAGGACDAKAAATWMSLRSGAFHSEAFSHGPSCASAVVTIVVRGPGGAPLWVDAMPVSQLMTFQAVKTNAQMRAALSDWLEQPGSFKSSADLPPWAQGADAPKAGEFPFYPETEVDRDAYEKVRAAKVPVFCYVQGMESMACAVLQDGGMSKIGVQTFPG